MIELFKPSFDGREKEEVGKVLESRWILSGPKAQEFEKKFAKYVGSKYAISLNSGTAALHLALTCADIKNKEVITTSMTFVSTNHAILYNGGIPVFVDVEPDTLNIDAKKIEAAITPKTKAILCVHYGGHACDMDAIHKIAKKYKLLVIEDAAHACGSKYKNKRVGGISDITCFSFHGVKNLTTGDGGMITTNNEAWARRLKGLRWLGINRDSFDRSGTVVGKKHWYYNVEELGWKYQMNDIAAAIGLIQLAKLEKTNARRRAIRGVYNRALAKLPWLEIPVQKSYTTSSSHNYVVKLKKAQQRDLFVDHLTSKEIRTGMHYFPNHLYDMYEPYRRSLPVLEKVWQRIVTLPMYPDMTDAEMAQVISAVKGFSPKK